MDVFSAQKGQFYSKLICFPMLRFKVDPKTEISHMDGIAEEEQMI